MTTNKQALNILGNCQVISRGGRYLLLSYDDAQKIEQALTQYNQAQPVNKMMLDALIAIEDESRYMNHLSPENLKIACGIERRCRQVIAAASSAPVVEVVDGLGEAITLFTNDIFANSPKQLKMLLEAARLQLARQKGRM